MHLFGVAYTAVAFFFWPEDSVQPLVDAGMVADLNLCSSGVHNVSEQCKACCKRECWYKEQLIGGGRMEDTCHDVPTLPNEVYIYIYVMNLIEP